MSDEDHFVVIRVYQPSDEAECSKLIQEGVMSTVRPSFFTALTREVTIQVIITMAAVMFVFIGLSPTICILAVPVTIILIYIGVYVGHLIKVSSLADEAAQIPKTFLSSKYTCFWVAEAYEPYCLRKNPTQVKYTILKEDQLDFRLQNDKIYCKKVVGIVGIIRCEVVYEAAWLKRMSVNYKYQRKGIANALLDKAIEFCKQRGYESIELVTSECHDTARKLYLKKGFKLRQLYHKPILGAFIQVLMYQFSLALPSNQAQRES